MEGIEPSYAAWEAAVLPLNYTREDLDFTQVTANIQITVAITVFYSADSILENTV